MRATPRLAIGSLPASSASLMSPKHLPPAARLTASLAPPRSTRLRARSVPELVDEGFGALRRYPGLLLGTAALFLAPVSLVAALVDGGETTSRFVIAGSWSAAAVWLGGLSLAAALMGLPLARAVGQAASGAVPAWRGCYRISARAWASVVVVWVVLAALRLVGSVLVVPLLALSVLALPLSAVVALEGTGPWRGLSRSWSITTASFGRALGLVSLQLLVGAFLTVSLGLVPYLVILAQPPGWQRPLANLGQLALGLLLSPAAAWSAAAFYLDERIRHDGLDLEVRLAEWDGARAEGLDRADANQYQGPRAARR